MTSAEPALLMCPEGHPTRPSDVFCQTCGTRLSTPDRTCLNGHAMAASHTFCGLCSAPAQPSRCFHCGTALDSAMEYCPTCGSAIRPSTSAPADRPKPKAPWDFAPLPPMSGAADPFSELTSFRWVPVVQRPPDPQGRPLAAYGQRVAAGFADLGILLVCLILIVVAAVASVASSTQGSGTSSTITLVVFWVLMFVAVDLFYRVGFTAVWGQTPGKAMCHIKVVLATDGAVPGWGPAFLRWLVGEAAALVPSIGTVLYLLVIVSPLWDDRLQSWADKAAGTLVVSTRPRP